MFAAQGSRPCPHSLGAALALFRNTGRKKLQNVMAITDFLALFWQSNHNQKRGDCDDTRDSGYGLRWHGADYGLWVWSAPAVSRRLSSSLPAEAPGTPMALFPGASVFSFTS